MTSPFPGMDPYIENRRLWSDFHSNLASEIQAALNQQIQPNYYAGLTEYVTYETVEVAKPVGIRPDVAIWQTTPEVGNVAVATQPVTEAPILSAIDLEVSLSLYSVEVRAVEGDVLVTAIEILSPINKRPQHEARLDYLRKRRDLLRSGAHFIELDLLRGGERSPLTQSVPPAPYYITLSRANRRPVVEVWPAQLWEALPIVPVPLLEPDPDVPLALGDRVKAVYLRGAYKARIDYEAAPPPPALSVVEAEWVNGLLKARKSSEK